MPAAYEFKSVVVETMAGEPYQNVGETLDFYGAQGWQLVSVQVIQPALQTIFYLMRQKTGP